MRPYFDEGGITIYHGDCREVLPELQRLACTVAAHYPHPEPPNALTADPRLHTANTEHCGTLADVAVTDPPYGIRKAEWDDVFPLDWLDVVAASCSTALAVMPGINNVLLMPPSLPPFEYRWMLSVQITNGMTRGLMGFGNWIPVLVYARRDESLYRPQQDATAIPICGEMPDHPSPKPLRAMTWIVSRLPEGTILDPFMGSGTTLRAAKDLGRKAIGIEIEERYCEIAANRMAQGVLV